jgi:hypothetical protein
LSKKPVNYKVLLVLAPVLILLGLAGFVIPAEQALTSGTPAYNLFHLGSGAIGLVLLLLRKENYVRGFNILFGLIDLYQALASYEHLFPEQYFQWTKVDDILHLVIGAGLVSVGAYGFITKR